MSELQIYTVRDTAAEAYMIPFFSHNDATAQRTMADCVAEPGHQFNRNPEDFQLFHIGTYSQDDGMVVQSPPKFIRQLVELRRNDAQLGPVDVQSPVLASPTG